MNFLRLKNGVVEISKLKLNDTIIVCSLIKRHRFKVHFHHFYFGIRVNFRRIFLLVHLG